MMGYYVSMALRVEIGYLNLQNEQTKNELGTSP